MRTFPNRTQPSNGLLSENTRIAILETFMKVHGPATEQQLAAVIQAAAEAVTALACFEFVMRGDLMAELAPSGTIFHKTNSRVKGLEPTGTILRFAAEVRA